MKSVITTSGQQTIKLGQKLAKKFRGGEIIALSGNLGAGKTTLIKGIAQGLGIKKIITSPTFVLMKVYNLKPKNYKLKYLIHIDCYRLDSETDIINIGALEYFGRPDSLVVIEWPEKIKKILTKKTHKIKIKILDGNKRKILLN